MLTLSTPLLRLSLAPHLGAGIADLSLRGPSGFFFPLMRRAAPDETNASLLASFFMLPWVNRIRAGTFPFSGRNHTINTNTADGMAQHGDVRKRPWSLTSHTDTSATLDFDSRAFTGADAVNWPWSFSSRAIYTLTPSPTGGTLRIDLSLRNTDTSPFPAAVGHHPYFARTLWDASDNLHLSMPVAARYPLRDGCAIAPAAPDDLSRHLRTLARIPNQHIDAVFAANPPNPPNPAALASPEANTALLHWPASAVQLRIRASANLAHWILYAPHARPDDAAHPSPLSFIAVEPQSQVNDALNLVAATGDPTTGTITLNPGEALSTRCEFDVESPRDP